MGRNRIETVVSMRTMRWIAIASMSLAACWRGAAPAESPPPEPAPVRVAATPARAQEAGAPGDAEAASLVEEADKAFERVDLAAAEALYKRAIAYPNAPVAGYARYKLAWVYFNNNHMQEALELFVQVARRSGEPTLAKAAGDDAARVYANVGRPQLARPFFERLDPDRVGRRLGLLADAYDMDGKPAEAAIVRAQLTP